MKFSCKRSRISCGFLKIAAGGGGREVLRMTKIANILIFQFSTKGGSEFGIIDRDKGHRN